MKSRGKKFLSYYQPYLGLFFADMGCAFVVAAITLILPLYVRYITKTVLAGELVNVRDEIYGTGATMVALVAVHTLCTFFVDYRGHMMGALMERDMRRELFDHYQKLSFRFYDEQRTGQLMSRLTNDLLSLSELYHHGPEDLVIGLLTLVGVFAISATLNTELTLLLLLFVPLMFLYAVYFNRKMNAALLRSKERIGDINAQVEDTLAGIRVVQSFANEAVEAAKFAHANERFVASRRDDYKSSAFFSSGMIAFTHLITIVVIVFGGIAIANARLDLPDLLTYLLYVGILVEPIQRLVNFARLYQEGVTGFHRFMELLEIEPEIQDQPDARVLQEPRGEIEFNHVCFRYHRAERAILDDFSLHIGVGEQVALVGFSGVGKTTLCSLIPRFYPVDAGEIRIDGVPIDAIALHSLRRNIGIVQQDIYLFAGTVFDNIRYGQPDADEAAVIAAAKQANAHDFIMALPNGYATEVGQRGVKLSGGQRQRLSIARVFLKDPAIIILDEATSALDNESEQAIQASLETLTNNRTTLVIAHRLSTVRNAQRIVVLTENGIEQQGTHETLLAAGGTYALLYNMQFRL